MNLNEISGKHILINDMYCFVYLSIIINWYNWSHPCQENWVAIVRASCIMWGLGVVDSGGGYQSI